MDFGRRYSNWIKLLHLGENCYNTTHHMFSGMSSFQDLYGYDAPYFMDMFIGDNRGLKAKD